MNLLREIQALQSTGDSFYKKGVFPSVMSIKLFNNEYLDNNIFFTAITTYTLGAIVCDFSQDERSIFTILKSNSMDAFVSYNNANKKLTYNFYPNFPDTPFAGLGKFSQWGLLRLPDDLDDTSMIYLSLESSRKKNIELKKLMELQATKRKKVVSTLEKYQKSKVYKSWFVTKMRQDIDVCVICNVLLFVKKKELSFSMVDDDSLDFICDVISNDYHVDSPNIVSPHYKHIAIILYHVTRLLVEIDHEKLNKLREKLIGDIKMQYGNANNTIEKIILLSSLFRLGQEQPFKLPYDIFEEDVANFPWFYSDPLYGANIKLKKVLGKKHFFKSYYTCKAYYLTLFLELEKLSKATWILEKNKRCLKF